METFMRSVLTGYVQYFNRHQRREGSMFVGGTGLRSRWNADRD